MLDAVILAGGLGTRLAQAVPYLPKALAPIQGAPFLELLLSQLAQSGLIAKVVLALGHKASAIEDYVKSRTSLPFPVDFSIEPEPLGTGGALLLALPKTAKSTLLALNGDSFSDIDFKSFYDFHLANNAALTISCRHVEDASRYGSAQIDASGRIRRFIEKSTQPNSGWINSGMYLIQRDLLLACSAGACSLERDLFPRFIEKAAFGYPHSGVFIDIGTPNSYEQAQRILQPWVQL